MDARPAFVAALLVAAAPLACGSLGSDDSGGGHGSIALAEIPKEIAKAECALVADCLGPIARLFVQGADCETEIQRQFEDGDFARLKSAVDAGRAVYRADQARACVDALRAGGCS